MNYMYITGTGSGIGRALAELLLQEQDNKVTGISRTKTIEHERYWHLTADLSLPAGLVNVVFSPHPDAGKLVLVNNSGSMGPVGYTGKLNAERIRKTYQLNLITPALLMNEFIKTYRHGACDKVIINVSSGAARNPVDGWSTYCSTKAGLDMLSEVAQLEERKAAPAHPFRIYSVNPGLTDTPMQDEIRKVTRESFSRVDEFIAYKANGSLKDPWWVAGKIIELIDGTVTTDKTVISVKEF